MSKIKTNPRRIKDCIVAIKNSSLDDEKKETVVKVLKQYQQDKQVGIYTDGQIIEILKKSIIALKDGVEYDILVDLLQNIVDNMYNRNYF